MKAGRMLVVLATSALLIGTFGAGAAIAKKRKTGVVFNSGSPSVSKNGKVRARGSLRSAQACRAHRGMKLFLTDAGGALLATLDSKTSDLNGNFNLRGRLSGPVAGTAVYVQVKAIKKKTRKDFCRAGFSPVIQLIVPA
ncbi:MAG: hypothetical protein ACRDL6_10700 [Solirubrobacterales bacterium]